VPSLSLLIPTVGKLELECALASVAPQLQPQDEVIVIGDTLDNPLIESRRIVESFGPQFRWLEYAGTEHTWGHDQLNHGIANARGDYLHFNDDDDIWTLDALDCIREAIAQSPGRVLLFKFMSWHRMIFWEKEGYLLQDHVGGHCIVCPNVPGKVGLWAPHYQGDFNFVMSTILLSGGIGRVVWVDRIVAVARPDQQTRCEVLAFVGRKLAV